MMENLTVLHMLNIMLEICSALWLMEKIDREIVLLRFHVNFSRFLLFPNVILECYMIMFVSEQISRHDENSW